MPEYPWAVAILLGKRKQKTKNVLVGSDSVVVKALEQKFDTIISKYDSENPRVFSYVEIDSEVPIEEHPSCTFWKNPPISKNEPLLTYIVSVLAPEAKDKTKFVKQLMFDSESARDFDVLYWRVKLVVEQNKEFAWDKQPWDAPLSWVKPTDDLDVRLGRLYHDIRSYIVVMHDYKAEIKELGLSQGKISYLKNLKLSISNMIKSLSILSKWKSQKLSAVQTTFLISSVWSNNGS